MDNFNFNLFKYFYYVVLYNGFTNASNNLSVAQPSLSLSIKKLEEELSIKLIDRSSKQFSLTDEGSRLFQVLKPLFESVEENVSLFNKNAKFYEINIGVRFSYGKALFSDFLDSFNKKFPNIKLNIDFYSKLDFNKVKNKEYDIVIDDNEYIKQIENVSTKQLCILKNYFICGRKLYDIYKEILSVEEMDNERFVSYRPSLKTGKFQQFCYTNNVSFVDVISLNESELYYKLIEDNYGIGFSNKLLLKDYLKSKSLFIINIKERIFDDILSVAYTKQDINMNNFIKMLEEYIKEEVK